MFAVIAGHRHILIQNFLLLLPPGGSIPLPTASVSSVLVTLFSRLLIRIPVFSDE